MNTKDTVDAFSEMAAEKMSAPAVELFARAILCNWLVCLAIWASARTSNDAAKCIIIFWCLYAFIAAGFEHSVANMTVFSIALLSEHPDSVTFAGAVRNLFWVTAGNATAGVLFVGGFYWVTAGRPVFSDNGSRQRSASGIAGHGTYGTVASQVISPIRSLKCCVVLPFKAVKRFSRLSNDLKDNRRHRAVLTPCVRIDDVGGVS